MNAPASGPAGEAAEYSRGGLRVNVETAASTRGTDGTHGALACYSITLL